MFKQPNLQFNHSRCKQTSYTWLLPGNKIFAIGYFLEHWSGGFIVLLHKKGSVNDVGNYGDITVLSTLGKTVYKGF